MKKLGMLAGMVVMMFGMVAGIQAAEKEKANGLTGELGCAKCNFGEVSKAKGCGSSLKVGEKVYLIKASKKGGAAVTKQLATGCNKPSLGEWKLDGKVSKDDKGKEWIVVDAAKLVKAPKAPAKDAKKEKKDKKDTKEGS